jgi:hypothetical protein
MGEKRMTFDINEAIKESHADLQHNALMILIFGESHAGKSTLCGTFGVKTLHIYTKAESHGVKGSYAQGSSNVEPLCITRYKGKDVDPDEAYANLLGVLKAPPKQFKAIAVDGATEIENLIRSTKEFKTRCLTKSGGHDNFKEPEAVMTMFRPIIAELQKLSEAGIHTAMTCILDVQDRDTDGKILDSKPHLSTYSVATGIRQQFGITIAIGERTKGEKTAHRIQFDSNISRVSKDQSGQVKKMACLRPRFAGKMELPPHLPAELSELIKMLEVPK